MAAGVPESRAGVVFGVRPSRVGDPQSLIRFTFADGAGANEVTNEAARRSRFVVDTGIIPPWRSMERAAQPDVSAAR